MRKITIEIEDKTFERLKKIKQASSYGSWRKFFIGLVLHACDYDQFIMRKRSASLPIDKLIMLGEIGRGGE